MGGSSNNLVPVVSKIFCASSQTTLMVRKRPQVMNGGGFVVLNCRGGDVVFSVHGCGILGANGELILKDGDGAPILYIRKKGGILQALSAHNRWKGYLMEFGRPSKPVFSLREPRPLAVSNHHIKISVEPKGRNCSDWDFTVEGSFDRKACSIVDRRGKIVAKVGNREEEKVAASKDFYHVVVQPGYDQAFVVGVIAVLDNIHGESTTC